MRPQSQSEPSNQLHSSYLYSTSPDPFDPKSLVILSDYLETKPRIFRRVKGIGGDEEDMMANLDISLRVGRFDRAVSLINRLGHFHAVGSPEYLAIHNRFLKAMVMHMIVTRQHAMVPTLQRWFEVDMPGGNVRPDATTMALMLKMCLRMLDGPKRNRQVRKYWEMVKDEGCEEDVLSQLILGEQELGELSEVLIRF